MLLLLTGASGVGKSTVRAIVAERVIPRIRAVELRDVVPIPAAPTSPGVSGRPSRSSNKRSRSRRRIATCSWMRHHVDDPHHRPEVLQHAGDPSMRWERLDTTPWGFTTIDTTNKTPDAVATEVLAWLEPYRSAAGQAIR